jgi:acyl-CoA reductase-like NAD-dependent aldehyde dehydrogenase
MARAGVLRRNSATAGVLEGLPFGGWKASGWGEAEHAEADALFFTRHQAWIPGKEEIS